MSPIAENTYDYIVVGGGTAGCVMARRLSESGDARVLMLEAGGKGDDLFIRMPAGNGFLFGNPKYDWGYRSAPQQQLLGRRIYYPRGRAMGGSSIMNGMLHIRGNARDYDSWNLPGWRYRDLLPYFRKLETAAHHDDEYHGHSGPVRITPAANYGDLDQAFVEASQQAGHCYNTDFNAGDQLGVGLLDVAVHEGKRQSTALAYLSDRSALTHLSIRTGAMAHKIITADGRARGIRYAAGAQISTAYASREIILCLGTFATPQLLMLSGIGPARHLAEHDIPVILDLPGVGKNLQDHMNYPMQYGCTDESVTLAKFQRIDRALGIGIQYLLNKSGPCANPFWSTHLFFGLNGSDPVPDLQAMFTRMIVRETPARPPGLSLNNLGSRFLVRGKQAACGFQIDMNLMHPQSRGSVRLKSSRPLDHPVIDPNFLSAEQDRRALVAGIRVLRDVVNQPALDEYRGEEIQPGTGACTDAQLLESIRKYLTTGHHPVGTCKMGMPEDGMAVVSPELKVFGMDNLRIVDGSIMPTIVTGNTNAPIIALAEKTADLVLDTAMPAGSPASRQRHGQAPQATGQTESLQRAAQPAGNIGVT